MGTAIRNVIKEKNGSSTAPVGEHMVRPRERLFGFINGQTGAGNPNSQGFVHQIKDGHGSQDASAGNHPLINALRNGGDLLHVFGDFPTLADPRHADAYSPLGTPSSACGPPRRSGRA